MKIIKKFSFALCISSATFAVSSEIDINNFNQKQERILSELAKRYECRVPDEYAIYFSTNTQADWPWAYHAFKQFTDQNAWDKKNKSEKDILIKLWQPIAHAYWAHYFAKAWGKEQAKYYLEMLFKDVESNTIIFASSDYNVYLGSLVASEADSVYVLSNDLLSDRTYVGYLEVVTKNKISLPDSNKASDIAKPIICDWIVNDAEKVAPTLSLKKIRMISHKLSYEIYKTNKNNYKLYVDQSNLPSWSLPYLEPHGLLMLLKAEPVENISDIVIRADFDCWNKVVHQTRDAPYAESKELREALSLMRIGSSRYYSFHERFDLAHNALEQARGIDPLSQNSLIETIRIKIRENNLEDARRLLDINRNIISNSLITLELAEQIDLYKQYHVRVNVLERKLESSHLLENEMLELADLYNAVGAYRKFKSIAYKILDNNASSGAFYSLLRICYLANRHDIIENAMAKSQKVIHLNNSLNRVALYSYVGDMSNSVDIIKEVIDRYGTNAISVLKEDKRVDLLRDNKAFKQMLHN